MANTRAHGQDGCGKYKHGSVPTTPESTDRDDASIADSIAAADGSIQVPPHENVAPHVQSMGPPNVIITGTAYLAPSWRQVLILNVSLCTKVST